MTFLRQSAEHIFQQHGTRMDDVWVVLPTRRAVSFFQQELAGCTDRPFLSPHALSVDDFITQASGLQIIDSVSLLFELYDVFREIDPLLEFGRFLNWATVLLSDLDRIDQYLIKPSELFTYMSAAKALERWQPELPSGANITLQTAGTQRYFKLFDNLQAAYTALRERLRSKGLAYRGMAYRWLAEHVDVMLLENPAYEKIYFIGFNALSRSEEVIVQTLVKARKAEMLWDADAYYLRKRTQEAGKMLRSYREAGWSSPWRWEGEHLTQMPKRIQIIGVPNASMQAKVAAHIHEEWQKEDAAAGMEPPPQTALVLGDETLLLPVLYSLGESVQDLNVTMGLSLRNSLLFTLIDGIFEMQRTVAEFRKKDGSTVRLPKFNHRHVTKVLSHPFILQYEQRMLTPADPAETGAVRRVLHEIRTQNLVYLDEEQLLTLGENNPLFRVLFRRWPTGRPLVVIHQFYALIDLLREVYGQQQDAIETEYLLLFQNLLRQLETTLERDERNELVDIRSLKQFLYELIRQTSIPFESEGRSSLQVMGMLETRALDFDRLILLSVNEGVLPQSRKLNSLIPFDACREVGLPTYQDQESVMSYHFYRLLQRAGEVVLLHVTSADAYGSGRGEKSRYILQIEHELKAAAGDNLTIEYPQVRFGRPVANVSRSFGDDLVIPKSRQVLEQLRNQLQPRRNQHDEETGGLYATHLNHLVNCSLRYYFSRVIKIREDETVEENLDAAEFGDWLHQTLETLDQDYRMKQQPVDEQRVKQVLRQKYEALFGKRVIDSGMNFLLYRIAEDLMVRFNNQQNERYGDALTVLQTEQEWSTHLDVETAIGPVRVRIAGKIDRVERLNEQGRITLRVADYKTGPVQEKDAKAEPDQLLNNPRLDKARQLWLYQYLVYKKMLQEGGLTFNGWQTGVDTPVVAGFYSFRNLNAGFIETNLRLGDARAYVEQSEDYLRKAIADLFDPRLPFRKTDDKKRCQLCDFRKLCGR